MADAESSDANSSAENEPDTDAVVPIVEIVAIDAYRAALRGYDGATLAALMQSFGAAEPPPQGRTALAVRIAEYLGEPRIAARLIATLPHSIRLALSLMIVSETHAWPMRALRHALAVLGLDATQVVPPLFRAWTSRRRAARR